MADIPDGVTHDVARYSVAWEILKATRLKYPIPGGMKAEDYLVIVTNEFIKIRTALESNKPLEK